MEIRFFKLPGLDHGAHGAIHYENPSGKKCIEAPDHFRVLEMYCIHIQSLAADSDSIEKLGVRFSIAETVQARTSSPASLHNVSSCRVVKPRLTWL